MLKNSINSLQENILTNRCTLEKHNLDYVAVCLNVNCKSNLACPKCLIYKHSNCQESILFIEDVFQENTSSILSISNFNDIKVLHEKIKSIKKEKVDKDYLLREINSRFTKIIDNFTVKLNDLKNNLTNIINEKLTLDFDVTKDVNSFLKFNILKIFLCEMGLKENKEDYYKFADDDSKAIIQWSKTSTHEEKVNFLKNYDSFIRKDLIEYYKNFNLYSQMQKDGDFMKRLNLIFDELKSFLDEKLSWNNLSLIKYGTKNFMFDKNKKSKSIGLDHSSFKATKIHSHGYDAVLGDLKLTKGHEIIKWKLILNGLEANDVHSENQWIFFGIVEEQQLNTISSFESFPYSKCIGYSTFNQSYNIIVENGLLQTFLNDDVIELTFDSEKGCFEILNSSNDLKAYNNNLNLNSVYYPFVILYAPGNSVELKFSN